MESGKQEGLPLFEQQKTEKELCDSMEIIAKEDKEVLKAHLTKPRENKEAGLSFTFTFFNNDCLRLYLTNTNHWGIYTKYNLPVDENPEREIIDGYFGEAIAQKTKVMIDDSTLLLKKYPDLKSEKNIIRIIREKIEGFLGLY